VDEIGFSIRSAANKPYCAIGNIYKLDKVVGKISLTNCQFIPADNKQVMFYAQYQASYTDSAQAASQHDGVVQFACSLNR
jgi:hypothetical protein